MVERSRPTTEVAKESDHTVNTTLTVLIMAAAAIRTTAARWCRRSTRSGDSGCSAGASARASRKAGGSSRWRRMR